MGLLAEAWRELTAYRLSRMDVNQAGIARRNELRAMGLRNRREQLDTLCFNIRAADQERQYPSMRPKQSLFEQCLY